MNLLGSSGGTLNKGPLLFSHNGAYTFCSKNVDIVVLDSTTCNPVRVLQSKRDTKPGHGLPIVSLALHPRNSDQILSLSEDKMLCVWNYNTGELVHRTVLSFFEGKAKAIYTAPSAEEHENIILLTQKPPVPNKEKAKQREKLSGNEEPRNDGIGEDGNRTASMGQHGTEKKEPSSSRVDKRRGTNVNDVVRIYMFPVTELWQRKALNDRKTRYSTLTTQAHGALSADGRHFALAEKTRITIFRLSKDKAFNYPVVVPARGPVGKVALHPKDTVLFWSSARDGKIMMQPFSELSEAKLPDPIKLHWHAHPAHSLSIDFKGRSLLSGGEEGVVVIWDLGRLEPLFLPHLSSKIVSLACSPSDEYYAFLLECGTVATFVPGYRSLAGRFEGIKCNNAKGSRIGLVRDPRNPSCVLLTSIQGELQCYDALRGASLPPNAIDICQQNFYGRGKDSKREMIFADVFNVAFTHDGRWMVSYDRRLTDNRHLQCDSLRFWKQSQGGYETFTAVDAPHNDVLNQIAICPVRIGGFYHCATVGADARVKLWSSAGQRTVNMGKSGEGIQKTSWLLNGSLAFRNFPCNAAAYSQDGTVLAVAFGRVIRLYDPLNQEFMTSLMAYPSLKDIKEMIFVQQQYIVALDGEILYVWDLEGRNMISMIQMSCRRLKLSPDGDSFYCITDTQRKGKASSSSIFQFTPLQEIPKAGYKHSRLINDYAFVREDPEKEPILVFIDDRSIVSCIGLDEETRLPLDTAVERYAHRLNKDRNASIATAKDSKNTMGDDEEEEEEEEEEESAFPTPKLQILLNLPHIMTEKLILTHTPSCDLPSTLRAFDHFITYKLTPAIVKAN